MQHPLGCFSNPLAAVFIQPIAGAPLVQGRVDLADFRFNDSSQSGQLFRSHDSLLCC